MKLYPTQYRQLRVGFCDKENFLTKDGDILLATIKFIKQLSKANRFTGPCLVPYYRQILPTFNQYILKNKNTQGQFVYSQRLGKDIGETIAECLNTLEETGGDKALFHIKSMVPTYETNAIILRTK